MQRLSGRKKLAFALLVQGLFWAGAALVLGLGEWWASSRIALPGDLFTRSAKLNHTWPQRKQRLQTFYSERSGGAVDPWVQTFNGQCWLESYDVEPYAAEGTYRIFYVGDSFVEGAVPMEDSLPSVIERELNAALEPAGHAVEVINTGTLSYSPSLYYVLTRHVIARYDPDAIVVCVDMTDDYDDWKYSYTAVFDAEGKLWGVPPRQIHEAVFVDTAEGSVRSSWVTGLQLWLFQHSHLYNYARRTLWPIPPTPPAQLPPDDGESGSYQRWSWCKESWDETTRRQAELTLGYVADLAAYCADRGIRLLITGVPHYSQFVGPEGGSPAWSRRPHTELERVAARAGAAYLDSHRALAPVIDRSQQDDYYHPGDMHFNARGNAAWATAHLEAIQDPQRALLPSAFYASFSR